RHGEIPERGVLNDRSYIVREERPPGEVSNASEPGGEEVVQPHRGSQYGLHLALEPKLLTLRIRVPLSDSLKETKHRQRMRSDELCGLLIGRIDFDRRVLPCSELFPCVGSPRSFIVVGLGLEIP